MRRPPTPRWQCAWAAAVLVLALAFAAQPATAARPRSALRASPLHTHARAHALPWHEIGPGAGVFPLGAHFDRAASAITVVALMPRSDKPTVFCAHSADNHPPAEYEAAVARVLIDGLTAKYETNMVTCKTPPWVTVLNTVHLCIGNCTTVLPAHFSMAVHNVRRARPPVFLGACLRIFNNPASYDTSVDEVVTFLEFHKLVGVEHFTIYAHASTSNAIKCALRSYQRDGTVKIVHVELPVAENLVHPRGQFSTLNDCIYRNKGFYTFVLHADVDEFVVPRKHHALVPYIQEQMRNQSLSQIGLRSAFFYREANESMLNGYERENYVFPFTTRSKYIALTDDIDMASVHEVITRNGSTVVADPDHFLLHHYRKMRKCGDTVCADGTSTSGLKLGSMVEDDAMARFVVPVDDAVRRRHELMELHEGECMKE